jgi:plastocyanin domain-containing protein
LRDLLKKDLKMKKNIFVFTFAGLIIFLLIGFSVQNKMNLKPEEVITILVKNDGYHPSLVQIPVGKNVKLKFIREDESACSSAVYFPEIFTSGYVLFMNKPVEVNIPPQNASEINFMCQSGAYRGKIIVAG